MSATNLDGVPDPSSYRPAPGTIPLEPGVYKFRDPRGRVIYVGKAKSLRQRLNSYFADLSNLHQRTRQMVTSAGSVEWTVVRTEVEALQLEYTWIKEFDPRFNVRYRDDKSYPSLAVTLYEDYPRLQVMRGPKRKGVRYFGPYSHAWAIRETLDLLLRVFPARTCSAGVFKRAGQIGRPCLLGYIGKCSAPCVGRVTEDEHRQIVEDFCDFMAGKTDLMIKRLDRRMNEASANLEFELAARVRDDLEALRRAMEKQAVVFGDGTDADVVAFAEDDLEAAVQVFHVRGGRIRGQRGWVVDKLDPDTGRANSSSSSSRSSTARNRERPARGARPGAARRRRRAHRMAERAARVARATPRAATRRQARARRDGATQRGRVAQPAQAQARDRPHRAVASARRTAGAARRCRRRRCVSSASTSATCRARTSSRPWWCSRTASHARASTAASPCARARVTPTGSPRWSGAGSRATWTRRWSPVRRTPPRARVRASTRRPGVRRSSRTHRICVVVDGGAPQVAAAQAVLDDLGIDDVSLVGLAKRLEEVWLPGEQYPAILPRTSEGLYLLQRVRDEAHRFAITFHREKRSKSMTVSALDGDPRAAARPAARR